MRQDLVPSDPPCFFKLICQYLRKIGRNQVEPEKQFCFFCIPRSKINVVNDVFRIIDPSIIAIFVGALRNCILQIIFRFARIGEL